MPPKKGKGRGKRMQPEPESDVISAHDVVRETEPETQNSGDESVEQAAFNKKNVPVEQAICEWFADHPLFYDMSDANFKNRQRKDRLPIQGRTQYWRRRLSTRWFLRRRRTSVATAPNCCCCSIRSRIDISSSLPGGILSSGVT